MQVENCVVDWFRNRKVFVKELSATTWEMEEAGVEFKREKTNMELVKDLFQGQCAESCNQIKLQGESSSELMTSNMKKNVGNSLRAIR